MCHGIRVLRNTLADETTSTNDEPGDPHPPSLPADPQDPIDLYKRDRELTRHRGYPMLPA